MESIISNKSFKGTFLFSHLCVYGNEFWCPGLPVFSQFYFQKHFGGPSSNPFILNGDTLQFFREVFDSPLSVEAMYFLVPLVDSNLRWEIQKQFSSTFGNRLEFLYEDEFFLTLKISVIQKDARTELMEVLQTAKNICAKNYKACFWNDQLIVAAQAGFGNIEYARDLFIEMRKNVEEVAGLAWRKYHFDPALPEVEDAIYGRFKKASSCN